MEKNKSMPTAHLDWLTMSSSSVKKLKFSLLNNQE